MSNEHIKKFLDEYLAKPINDYAVLITGCWGSGKTFFISKYMGGKKHHKVRDWLMDSISRTVIYISLFGVKTRNDIENRIFEVLHPHLKKTEDSYLAQSGMSLIKALTSLTPITKDLGKYVCDAMELFNKTLCDKAKRSKKGLVVVFDDVERTDMDAPDILGYINEYVEHLGVSCILLADKERWDEANAMSIEKSTLHHLASTQEKVIGKIFNIQTSIDDVLSVWLDDKEFLDERILKVLRDNKMIIKEIIQRSGVNNFRSLKHTLLDFERFVKITSIWSYLENRKFTELFLSEFIALCYSIYIGELKASDIGVSNYLSQIQDNTIEDSPYDKFKKNYHGFEFLSEYSVDYSKSWMNIFIKYFGENVISVEVVNNVIRDEIWFDGHDKYWMSKVGDFFMCDEDADGIEALETFYNSMDNVGILDANNLYYLYYKLVYFADIGVLKENKTQFQIFILDYARNNAKKFKSYKMDSAEHYLSLFGELGRNGQDDNEEFWLKLKAIFEPYQKKNDDVTKRAINKFFEKFMPDSGNVYSLVMNNAWKEKDFQYFFSKFLELDLKYGQKNYVLHAISDLKDIDKGNEKIKTWCETLLPLVEFQWEKYLKDPKPLKNSQIMVHFLQKALKEIV